MALSRRHWRFVVRDQYGYAIQNALVYVYQPGTTTAFSGSAYDAASGGNAVTNPLTTNSQGEVEAWFDTDQEIDVFVTDNTDAAYRAVNGPTSTISFTAFTERDSIPLYPTDVADVENLPAAYVTALASNTAPLKAKSTPSAGSASTLSRDDHRHPFYAALGKTSKFTTTSDTNEQVIHTLAVAAGDVSTAGAMFRIQLKGYQTNSTTACTYTFRVRWGGLAGTQVFSIAFVGTTTAHTDNPVHLDFLLTVQSVGATGTITCSVSGDECITTAVANTPKLVLDAQAAAVTIDTTVAKDLVLTVQMSTTTGTPNLEVDNVLIERVA